MKSRICMIPMLALVCIAAMGVTEQSSFSSMAWGFGGGHRSQIEEYMAEVDLGLSAEEELALKKRIVDEGVIDRLRVGREEALTEEEVKAVRYLTRPVRAKDEANPHGQRWAMSLSCPDRLPLDEVEAILASRGLTVLTKSKGYASTHFELEVPLGVDPVAEARHLTEVEAKHVDPRWGENIVGVPHLGAHPTPFAVDAAGRSRVLIGKNQIQVSFVDPLTAAEIQAFSESEHLILLNPRADFSRIGPSWTTPNGFFFIADTVSVGEMCDRLYDRPEVRNVECQAYPHIGAYIPERNDPNDPNYSSNPAHSQWHFLQNRDADGGDSDGDDSRDFDVDAPEGWNLQVGSATTIVAIIDQGFKMDHEDLVGRWWVNPNETPGNGIDDDGNGFVDDVNAVNLEDSTGTPLLTYHGTMVAGVVGAATNNGDYGAGGNPGCRMMAIGFSSIDPPDYVLFNERLAVGIGYARAMGADIINMSIGLYVYSRGVEDSLAAAWASGVVSFAVAGNDHEDPSDDRLFPADYASVVKVAGTDDENRRYFTGTPPGTHGSGWGTGEWGPQLCAPAEDMFLLCDGRPIGPCNDSLWIDGVSGTSFATPIAAALAALVKDQHDITANNSTTSEKIVRILRGAVDDVHGDVTDELNSSSEPLRGPDHLGAGRVNFFEALAPPRIKIVLLIQSAITKFNEGDLNGNSVFNWMDEDMDGDSFRNSDDNNDDGDEFMDGDDVDDDEDGAWDEADTNYVLRSEIQPGELEIYVLFNESMLLDGQGGVDPTVKLILTDGSVLQFQPAAVGNDDWDTLYVANDWWHGKIESVTEDDISKMYGDMRLTISGTVDLAGDTLDWDLETPGAQPYEYPLVMPGFRKSASNPKSGVRKNTTDDRESTWPMGWGTIDVMGRGFNTDVSDPLSVQSMTIDIEWLYNNTTMVSGDAMTKTGRNFAYEWDQVGDSFIDGKYDVTLKAYDGSSGPILSDLKRGIVLDYSVQMMKELKGILGTSGGRERIEFYHGEWVNGELEVEMEEVMPLPGDTLFLEVWLNEPCMEESLILQMRGEYPVLELTLAKVDYDSTEFHWTGKLPFTTWDSMRNRMGGEMAIAGYGRDRQGNLLDADPSTEAYRDSTGQWHDYESESPGGGRGQARDDYHWDMTQACYIAPFQDVCIAIDASSSMNLAGWELSQVYSPQRLIDYMMADEDEGAHWRVAAWRFYSMTIEQIADYSFSLEDARGYLGTAAPQIVGVHEPGQYNPVNPFAGYMPNTDVENPLLEAALYAMAEYDEPKVICIWSDFYHNLGSSLEQVAATYHEVAEWDPIFLMANGGALYGSNCSEELREAARISGGGYFEAYGAAEVESLYKVIPLVIESRAFLAQVDGAGSDTIYVRADSTMSRLDVMVSLSAWSGRAIRKEREEGKERSRGIYQLKDPGGSLVGPSYTNSGLYQWQVESPQVGQWQLEVSEDPSIEYSMIARGSSPIELRLLSTGSIAEGVTDTIEVKLEWERLENEAFELVDQSGDVVASLTLNEERTRVYSGTYAFSEAGHYRVRIRGDLGTQVVERETELCLNVRAAPTIELISPAAGETHSAGTSYTIEWIDSCPERNATVTIGYDDDDVYSGAEEIIATVEEAGADTGQAVWDVFSAPEGTWFVWACIDDSLNNPVRVYGGRVTVTKGYQEGWPVTIGGDIEKNLCLSDLDNNGTVEVIVGAKDSLLYVLNYDGTNYGVNWPYNCHGTLTSGAAVGDVDGDGEKEIVVACSDTALVWVLNADGVVESGWPQTMRSGTWSAPLLVDLVGGDGIPEIATAAYDSTLWAWDGFGTALGGNWPVSLAHINQNSSPAGGDIDEDGENEVVVSSRYGDWGAKVYAIEADGSIKWEYETDYPVWTSPAIADVDSDGKKEIIFTTFGFPVNTSRLFVLNGEDGSEASGWTGGKVIDQWAESSPAVGYLDQSGSSGIVIADGTGEVEAWNGSGTQLWNKTVSGSAIKSDPLIVDLTGDQTMEVVVGANRRVYTLNAVTGDTISAYSRGTESNTRSVAVGDLDGDGDLEIIATVLSGVIYAWDLPGVIWADGQEWPQLQRDEAKTGEYRESASPVAPELLDAEFVAPDSMRVTWQTVDEDVYGRDELVKKYVIYRDDEPYGVDGSTLAGEVDAPDTSFTEQSAAVGDPNQGVFYRVKAEDQYGNRSDLSDGTVGEVDFGTGGPGKRRDREKRGKPIAR